MLQHGREIAPSVSWEILVHVKRTGGISVNELAALLKMSYMGVKQHCDALKRRGYLDTWRRPKPTGRPEKIFRPTLKLDLILPNWGNELSFNILAYSAQVMGETAPERLLHSFLHQKAENWAAKMKGKTLEERARHFVKLRNAEGWMSELIPSEDNKQQWHIIEHHSPLNELARLYPAIWTIELLALEHCFQDLAKLSREDHEGRTRLILTLASRSSDTSSTPTPSPVFASAFATPINSPISGEQPIPASLDTPSPKVSFIPQDEPAIHPVETKAAEFPEPDIIEPKPQVMDQPAVLKSTNIADADEKSAAAETEPFTAESFPTFENSHQPPSPSESASSDVASHAVPDQKPSSIDAEATTSDSIATPPLTSILESDHREESHPVPPPPNPVSSSPHTPKRRTTSKAKPQPQGLLFDFD